MIFLLYIILGRLFLIFFLSAGIVVPPYQVNVHFLLPNIQSICEFMLTAQQDPDTEVRSSYPILDGRGTPSSYFALAPERGTSVPHSGG